MPGQHWPQAGQLVDVGTAEQAELHAVVDDVRPPEQLHLRLPVQRDGRPAPDLPLGAPVSVSWTSPAGQHVLPSSLVDRPTPGVPLWKLAPEGEPVVLQRREFVRVAEALRVRLQRDGDSSWSAALSDLSEGGARCVLRSTDDLQPGDLLHLALLLEGQQLALPAAVLAVEQAADRTTLRLQFQDLGRVGDLVRRHVLEQQQRARAVGRP